MANVLRYDEQLYDPLVRSLVLPEQRDSSDAPPVAATADDLHHGLASLYLGT
jgi:hypothetical protein